jgi:hypothetical protein
MVRAEPFVVATVALAVAAGCRDARKRTEIAPVASVEPEAERPIERRAPLVIAEGLDGPWGIFVDGDFLYWTEKGRRGPGSVQRARKTGAGRERLEGDPRRPFGLVTMAGTVYWTNTLPSHGGIGAGGAGGVMLATAATPAEPWALVGSTNRAFLGDGAGHLFWTDLARRTVEEGAVRGGVVVPTRVLATAQGRPIGIAVDDAGVDGVSAFPGYVYWADDAGVVARVSLRGGPVEELATGGDKTTGIALDDTHVYWSEWGSGLVARVPKGGGTKATVARGQDGIRAIALDATRIFWTHPKTGEIRSTPKAGGEIVVHATGQKHPYSLAVDERAIYWANVDGGTVMAVEK